MLGAHLFVQELALTFWSRTVCSMEGLPGPSWDPGTMGSKEGSLVSGEAVWRNSWAASESLSVMERMVLSVKSVFLLLCYAFEGWSLVLLSSCFARRFWFLAYCISCISCISCACILFAVFVCSFQALSYWYRLVFEYPGACSFHWKHQHCAQHT